MGIFDMDTAAAVEAAPERENGRETHDRHPEGKIPRDPNPCVLCGCPFAWQSVYGQVACWSCDRPPSTGFVRYRLAIVLDPDGTRRWERHPATSWTPGVGGGDVVGSDDGEGGGVVRREQIGDVESIIAGDRPSFGMTLADWFDSLAEGTDAVLRFKDTRSSNQ